MRSKYRCSCVLQFTRFHTVSCVLHRSMSRVIPRIEFVYMVLFYDLAGAEAPAMRRVYTEYVLPESRCPGGGGNNQKLVRFSIGHFSQAMEVYCYT